ncbi:nucleotidyltransferase domain-containing protein [Robertmurraya sp. P23]|uniref:nucleotidyltransferase domain-containing protein n=1 Tax=Robertmurraya sp. P23 TaxID=3436931 RepID=UPI003D9602D6
MKSVCEVNLSTIPAELQLILNLLEDNYLLFEERISDREINWDIFIKLSYHHRLYPALYNKLAQTNIPWIPKNVLQKLKTSYEKNTFHMLFLSREMETINHALQANKIQTLFLKGPILAKDLYGDLSSRTCGDLDILTSIHDLQAVEEILVELGYQKDEYIKTLLGDWKWRHHHFTYFHNTHGTKVEIHWRLNPAPSNEPSFSQLWSRKREYVLKEKPIYYLGEEDLFYFLVTHGARHGWSRLRWLMDIHQILKKDLDWMAIKQLLQECQSEKVAGQSLILSHSLFQTTITSDVRGLTTKKESMKLAQNAVFYFENMVNLHSEPVPIEISKYHARHLFSLMSLQQKIVHLLSILHPFYTDAEILPLPRKLHFLYFPLRPFLLLWKRKNRHVLS